MENWLKNYPYRIEIGFGAFAFSGLMVLIIAAITISYQAFKSATSNPIDALNYE
jgi:putative ABC transport system permease protein